MDSLTASLQQTRMAAVHMHGGDTERYYHLNQQQKQQEERKEQQLSGGPSMEDLKERMAILESELERARQSLKIQFRDVEAAFQPCFLCKQGKHLVKLCPLQTRHSFLHVGSDEDEDCEDDGEGDWESEEEEGEEEGGEEEEEEEEEQQGAQENHQQGKHVEVKEPEAYTYFYNLERRI